MAADRTAHVTWSGSLMEGSGTIDERRERRVRPSRRQLGGAHRGHRRADESRGADRRRARVVLLDGALARARAGRYAAREARGRRDRDVRPGNGDHEDRADRARIRPGLDEAAFREAAEGAKENCPVSKALAAVPEITVDASLA